MQKLKHLFLLMLLSVIPLAGFADYKSDNLSMKVGDFKTLNAPSTSNSKYPNLSDKTSWNWSGPIEITSDGRPAGIAIKATGTGTAQVTCDAVFWDASVFGVGNTGFAYRTMTWYITIEGSGGGGTGGGDTGGGGSSFNGDKDFKYNDYVTSATEEGVSMTFWIHDSNSSENKKWPCGIMSDDPWNGKAAISKSTSGKVTIPEIVPGTKGCSVENSFKQRTLDLDGLIVKAINVAAFFECEKLAEVVIPSSVKSISTQAFDGCTSLEQITLLSSTPPELNEQAFMQEAYSRVNVRVPKGAKSAYKNAKVWSKFKYILEEGESIENAEVTGISFFTHDTMIIKIGDTFLAWYTLTPSNASTTITWSSDDSSIATVDQYGNVKGVGVGTTYINVKTANGKTDYLKVTVEQSPKPTDKILIVSAGGSHSLYIENDGTLWSFGLNNNGQLGNGTTSSRSIPVKIMSDVRSVLAGANNSFIIKTDGSLWACGLNEYGKLGDGTRIVRQTPVKIMSDVQSVSAGDYHSLILKTDGSLWACGYNKYGQLGDGTTTDRYTPVKIMSGVQSVSAGYCHSLILKTDGTLWACGWNMWYQLGDDTKTDRYTPVKIMSDVQSVSAGDSHSLILKTDGTLWACGYNYYGQLGDGTTSSRHTPVEIMSGVQSISAGKSYSLILKTDGTLWACGINDCGQLGDGTTTERHTPVKIMADVQSISTGSKHSFIIKNDGSLWACGKNDCGQLGDGTTTDRYTPVKIVDAPASTAVDVIKTDRVADSAIFSLSGQRLAAPHKGINIINGKKVVVK